MVFIGLYKVVIEMIFCVKTYIMGSVLDNST